MKEMSALIKHRGPDDYGEFVDSGIGIFSNRLSIIDLEGGHQPIFNEKGDVAIVFNGEIYNFPELKQNLEAKGHKFKTRSDTEVILHGFEEYGKNIFAMLDGMFAIALWDVSARRLVLARDRVGIKPLYYATASNGDLVFCSEVKGILAHPEISARVNSRALYDLMALYYIPFGLTLFEGIFRLPQGHYYDSKSGSVTSFWSPPEIKKNFAPTVESVRSALERSIKRQLISDVEVGSFLSGGLDTSTIVAFASKYYSGKLKTFCMGFGHADDEIQDARKVAEFFGTDHHDLIISDRSSLELYPRMVWHSEEPRFNTYSWFVNEYASKFVKVCLSGLGGDEIFFGYPTTSRFTAFQRMQSIMKIPGTSYLSALTSGKRKVLLSVAGNRAAAYLTVISPVYGQGEVRKIFAMPAEPDERALEDRMETSYFSNSKTENFIQQTVRAEFGTKLADHFLLIDDAMSMAHSLENRVPLLDNELIDLMLPVPYKYNYNGSEGKLLLRKAMAGILPQQCFSKPKQGFSLDILRWWKGELRETISNTIDRSEAVRKYFNVEVLRSLEPRAAESYGLASLLWHVFAFDIWHELFIENGPENLRAHGPKSVPL